ncbi:DNA-binding SARP family transcriptional activator [Prauserella shujinwangii]|uniref:DNA-binding SARP family transcriptional activator n=1 Tax=Prauserella shujinwangii TaxID=1453103 RepID=A0A2T0LP42_9PSEU|nr:AfsR/SARP family transcriptional regulator [Prauserella shujinwangii]PRX44998.1 DNA-binding SARP family transcriptional activator [Prauserella shujinwangii]
MRVTFEVLGPVVARDGAGTRLDLRGPRHRAVLARLLLARGRVVPVTRLVDDLWPDPPPDAVGAVRTFVAALRRALEPDRPRRAPARLLVTEGPGYALRADPDTVDAWRFERVVTESSASSASSVSPVSSALPRAAVAARLEEALGWWRGTAYADVADEPWARADRARLAELRLHAVELLAEARLALGHAAEVAADLDAHVAEHPWREEAWRLLALALYRTGRQGDALAVLRRARSLLADQLGVDPGPRLRDLEADILAHAEHLERGPEDAVGRVWAEAAAAYDRTVSSGARARLESTMDLLRTLAVTGGGGLLTARRHRVAAVAAAEELGDSELTARVIGAYDVPAIWMRVDDPGEAARVVAAAERVLPALAPGRHDAVRARLLATIAVESRGTRAPRGGEAARLAEEIARRLDDPALLAFALNGVFMQSCHRAGLAARRDGVGAELIAVSTRHGLVTYEVLGHLVRLQARAALADFTGADGHAEAADQLARRHDLPLVDVFTRWYSALRLDAAGTARAAEVEAAYRDAARLLDGAGMPGLADGLLPLALLCARVRRGRPAPTGDVGWGPYAPWARPLVLLARDRRADAAAALREVPDPPPDLLQEALWCLAGRAAVALGDRRAAERAADALRPAAGELAGAGSGLLTVGPVAEHLARLDDVLGGRAR